VRKLTAIVGAAAIAGAAYLGWRTDRASAAVGVAQERTLLERFDGGDLSAAELEVHVRALVRKLEREGPESPIAAARLAAIRAREIPEELRGSIDAALAAATAQAESATATRVMESLRAARTDGPALANDYLKRFPDGANRPAVERGLFEYAKQRQAAARAELRSFVVDSIPTLRAKARALREFLALHRETLSPEEVAAIEIAARAGERFSQAEHYSFRLSRAGGFQTARRIKVSVGCAGEIQEFAAAPATTAEWDAAVFTVRWKFGDPVRVQLLAQTRNPFDFSYHLAAEIGGAELAGLKAFANRTPAAATSEWSGSFASDGPVMAFADSPIDAAAWQAVEDYLHPGGKW
jgi:hypothetical protein